jgi:Holliday junction resolvase RusA-like endonuclease
MLVNNMKQEFTDGVAWASKMLRPVSSPVHITFIYQEANRKRDPDNITFAKKFILDGLVKAGVLPNDTQAWVVGFTETWRVVPDDVGVEVRIVEEEDGG